MKTVLILYEFFTPAYKGGGIIQSLTNIVKQFGDDFKFFVITTDKDLGESTSLEGIESNKWTNYESKTQVLYLPSRHLSYSRLKREISFINPDTVYINGLYSIYFTLYPLLITYNLKIKPKIIIAPRGMLQEGALKVKAFKKKIYYTIFKIISLHKNIVWHATDEQEVVDIKKMFGKNPDIVLATVLAKDLPSQELLSKKNIYKKRGELHLVTISLVTQKKNVLGVIEALYSLDSNLCITYDIYGPIKDTEYWNKCLALIETAPRNIKITYRGNLKPNKVIQTLQNYHFFVLLTYGENFGHAIFESLSAGRPVIISDKTPWKSLKSLNAGWDLDINNKEETLKIINYCSEMDNEEFEGMCEGAYTTAKKFILDSNFLEQYKQLF